jgi:nucleoid-associated protein YgaU
MSNVIKRHQTFWGDLPMRLVAIAALATATLAVTAPGAGRNVLTLAGPDFPAAVLALLSLVLLVVAGWALLVSALASVPALRSTAVAVTPRLLRGAVLAGVTATVAMTPAHGERADHVLDGLRLPDRPTVSAPAARPLVSDAVVVRPGDTVWGIAAEHLGARADAASIARATSRWHAANRHVIGPDPDLIHPGQRLVPPQEDHS